MCDNSGGDCPEYPPCNTVTHHLITEQVHKHTHKDYNHKLYRQLYYIKAYTLTGTLRCSLPI